jgi:hypothetical protein
MAKIGILKIKRLVEALIEFVKTDYEEKLEEGTESESFLLRCFDDDDYDVDIVYSDLAVDLFTREANTSKRKLETRLLFDRDRATLPTIHIREPGKTKGKMDGIGSLDEEYYTNEDESTQDLMRKSFSSQYELMITSSNRHEVLIIEEVMLALLIGAQDTLALNSPFYLFEFSVKEMMINNDLMPDPLFIKSIGINTSYDKTYPTLGENTFLTSILFEHNIL